MNAHYTNAHLIVAESLCLIENYNDYGSAASYCRIRPASTSEDLFNLLVYCEHKRENDKLQF